MQVNQPLSLLGALSPVKFMKRYWHKKPLLIRQAIPGMQPLLSRSALFDLAMRDDVQSRLVIQQAASATQPWRLRHGPFARRSLPPLKQPGWTLLVQSVDLLDVRVQALREQFRFVPDARLDDVMISYASDGGGVGPHFDSYDVFLLQAQGQRRWRIGRQKDLALQEGMPLNPGRFRARAGVCSPCRRHALSAASLRPRWSCSGGMHDLLHRLSCSRPSGIGASPFAGHGGTTRRCYAA